MSANRYKIYDDFYPHFITGSIIFGLPLFNNPKAVNIILENMEFLQTNRGIELFAYVIMENHFHAILRGNDLAVKINQFKSYSARKIIDLLKQNGHTKWLERLDTVKPKSKTDRNFQLWQEGSYPKQITGDDVMIQKAEYIHNNPVRRGYVDHPEDWRYSSARNYKRVNGLIPITKFSR
jgi:REP element-mobilizing transposase RayT